MEEFGETWKRKGQDESNTGDENKVEGLVKKWFVFLKKKLEQDPEFKSEVLQEQNNEREARERQHNQFIIQNQQIQTQQSQ